MLESVLNVERGLKFVSSAAFLGVMPKGNNKHSSEFVERSEDEIDETTGERAKLHTWLHALRN